MSTIELTHELEALTTDVLEDIAQAHFMFTDDCPSSLRSRILQRQAVASEILKSRMNPPTSASADTACL